MFFGSEMVGKPKTIPNLPLHRYWDGLFSLTGDFFIDGSILSFVVPIIKLDLNLSGWVPGNVKHLLKKYH